MLRLLMLLALLLLSGCEQKAIIKNRAKEALPITCMQLVLLKPNTYYEKRLRALYPFQSPCKNTLYFSYKNSIVCNSNQNAAQKAKGIPHAYLRFELKEQETLLYSYYLDLDEPLTGQTLKAALLQLIDELDIIPKAI